MARIKRCCVTSDEDDESLLVISFFYWDRNVDPQVFHFRRPRTEKCEKTLLRMIKTMSKEAQSNIERRRKEGRQRQRDAAKRSGKAAQGAETGGSDEEEGVEDKGVGINRKNAANNSTSQQNDAGDAGKNLEKPVSRPMFNVAPDNGPRDDKMKKQTEPQKRNADKNQLGGGDYYISLRILNAGDQTPVSVANFTNEQVFTPQHFLAIDDSFIYSIQVNTPHCVSIGMPQHVMIGFKNYAGVELENCRRETSKIFWMRPNRYDKHPDDIVIPDQLDAGFVSRVRKETGLADEEIEHWGEELYNAFYFEQWQICGREQSYQPIASDFGVPMKVLCIPVNDEGVAGAPKFIVGCGGNLNSGDSNSETFSIEWGPNCLLPFMTRKFLPLNNNDAEKSGDKFRIVSYNMLFDMKPDADFSRGDQQYPNCARRVLEIGYRMQLIRHELATYAADIYMLQECTFFTFLAHLKPFLIDELGYDGHLSLRRKRVSQSVVSFYRKERFDLVDSYDFHINNMMPPSAVGRERTVQRSETVFEGVAQRSLENVARFPQCRSNHLFILQLQEHFNAVGMPSQRNKPSANRIPSYGDHLIDSINNLAHVMQVFVLLDKLKPADSPNRHLIFTCNTHLYWHPNYPAYRLIQMQLILNKLEQIVHKNCESAGAHTFSVILCGDMNSSEERGVHGFLTEGSLPADFREWSEQDIMPVAENDDAEEPAAAAKSSRGGRRSTPVSESDDVQFEDDSGFQGVKVPELFGKFLTFPIDAYRFTHYIDEYNGRLDWIYYTNGNVAEKSMETSPVRMCNVLSMPDEELTKEWLPLPNTVFPSDHIAIGSDFISI